MDTNSIAGGMGMDRGVVQYQRGWERLRGGRATIQWARISCLVSPTCCSHQCIGKTFLFFACRLRLIKIPIDSVADTTDIFMCFFAHTEIAAIHMPTL